MTTADDSHQMPAVADADHLLDPFPWYATMRRETPVHRDPATDTWHLFRYADVQRVLGDWETFSSRTPPPPGQDDFNQSLITTDPPRHRSLRALAQQAFTPRRVDELAPRITEIAHGLLDRAADQRRMDFVRDFAIPLPVTVIAELLGVPLADQDDFKRWSDGW